ncbi:MAG: hypothetical protein ACYCXF_06370 [Thermoleophilia bacterium]
MANVEASDFSGQIDLSVKSVNQDYENQLNEILSLWTISRQKDREILGYQPLIVFQLQGHGVLFRIARTAIGTIRIKGNL